MRLRFDDQRPTLSLVAEGYREARETVGANAKDINPLTSDTSAPMELLASLHPFSYNT